MTSETPYAGLFIKKADPEVLKDFSRRASFFMRLSSSMIIRSAGDVIHRLFTTQESHGLLK